MNPYDTYGSPSEDRPSSRFQEDDPYERRETYRRRSPAGNDRRRPPPRKRSRSPVAIDRYQPGDRDRGARDDFYENKRPGTDRDRDDRRRQPSPAPANIDRYIPGQAADKPMIKVNPLTNPLALETQAGFSYFADWWRCEQQMKEDKERAKNGGRRPSDRVKGEREAKEEREKERAQIQTAYDQYKVDFQVRMARQFVLEHKSEEWFKERYLPEIRNPIKNRLTEFREGAFEQWVKDIEEGSLDGFTLEGIYKNDSDGAGGMVEKEEGEAVGGAEVMGVLDLVPAKGGDIRDEASQQPALLIKTLAPNVGREKIENFCKEHLGEEAGGFRWLSLSDPNPAKKCHRIGWIMLQPGGEESEDVMQDVERGDGRGEEGEEGEDKPETNGTTTSSPAQRALDRINGKVIEDQERGNFTCYVGIHQAPHHLRKKALWDLFSAPERVERDAELARRLATRLETDFGKDETTGGLAKIEARIEQMRSQGLLDAQPKQKKKNEFEDNDDEIKFDEEVEEGEENEDEEDDTEFLVTKKKLDMTVEYLRRVFNFCFFCVFEADSVHELIRKCPGGHLRRPRAGLSRSARTAAKASAMGEPFPLKRQDTKMENGVEGGAMSPIDERRPRYQNKADQQLQRAFNWVRTFEEKILQILEPENVDLKKLGGRPVEEALDEELAKFVNQEDEAKFRCKVPECAKLFKAEHFWRKHVEKRHEEWYSALKSDLDLVNTYVLDPSHIAPSRSDANSNGHFPLPSNHHLVNGTPRGFNMQNMNMNMNLMNFGQNGMMTLPSSAGMPGMSGPFMASSANNPFNNANSMPFVGADGQTHTGAIRRGGGRYNNNQRSGPYDRNNRGPGGRHNNNMHGGPGGLPMRNPSMNSMGGMGGMNMGYLAQGGGGGGGKWGDGAGGMAMGPREATAGRSIKSYEDLDAQPGVNGGRGAAAAAAGGEELDY